MKHFCTSSSLNCHVILMYYSTIHLFWKIYYLETIQRWHIPSLSNKYTNWWHKRYILKILCYLSLIPFIHGNTLVHCLKHTCKFSGIASFNCLIVSHLFISTSFQTQLNLLFGAKLQCLHKTWKPYINYIICTSFISCLSQNLSFVSSFLLLFWFL